VKKLVPFAVVAAISLGLAMAALAQGGSRQSFAGTFTSTAPGSPTAYRLAIDYRNPRDPEAKPHAVACLAPRGDGGRGPEPTELPAHSSAVPRLGSLDQHRDLHLPRRRLADSGDLLSVRARSDRAWQRSGRRARREQ